MIFLHSQFRTGSTYMWSKFRSIPQIRCYYEPFHDILIKYKKVLRTLEEEDRKGVSKGMRHPETDKHYFYEYPKAPDIDQIRYYSPNFNDVFLYKFYNDALKHQLFLYITYLNCYAQTYDQTALFQPVRSSGVLPYLKERFPQDSHYYILRNPRNQFASYWEEYLKSGNFYFIGCTLLWFAQYLKNGLADHPLKKELIYAASIQDFDTKIKTLKDSVSISKEAFYEIFYFIWLQGIYNGIGFAHAIVDIDALSDDQNYRLELSAYIIEKDGYEIDFSDAKVSSYSNYMNDSSFEPIEKIALEKFSKTENFSQLKSNAKFIPTYVKSIFNV